MGGTWVAHSVKRPALDFGSGHDLTFLGIEPCVGLCAVSVEPAWDSLSPPSLPLPLLMCALSQNKINVKKKKGYFML